MSSIARGAQTRISTALRFRIFIRFLLFLCPLTTSLTQTGCAGITPNPAGQLSASATKLNYGNVVVGTSSSQFVTLTNTSNAAISITNVSVTGPGLSSTGVSTGLILVTGNSVILNVIFSPSATGTLNGSITVTSSANNAPLAIALSGAAIEPVSHVVTLDLRSNSTDLTGYNVYRSLTSGGPYSKLNSLLVTSQSYVDSTVVAAQTYYYVATSIDSSGVESASSNQVSVTIPTP